MGTDWMNVVLYHYTDFNAEKLWQLTKEILVLQRVYYRNNVTDHVHVKLLVKALENDEVPIREFDNMQSLFDNIYMASPAFKHPAFKTEDEVRLITPVGDHVDDLGKKQYLITAERVSGYYNLDLLELCKMKGMNISDLLNIIRIGPKSEQSIKAFKSYLCSEGLQDLQEKVSVSECPLR